jgi:preprotein translocase subunit SecB
MQKFIKQFLIISTILVGFSISAFSKENITLYFDEIAIEDKVNLSIYGSAESEDFSSHKWQIVNVKVKDSKNKELLFSTETDKKGFWEVENIDIKDFNDDRRWGSFGFFSR